MTNAIPPELAVPAGGPHWVPAPLPRPDVPDAGPDATRWATPTSDYARAPGGSSEWMPPAPVPAGLPAAVQPVTDRVGWLMAGRAQMSTETGLGSPAA